MFGFVRQLFDYDGSNLFPRTRPDAFVSCVADSSAVNITTIGELVDTSYLDPSVAWETEMGWEPEFIYRINPEQSRVTGELYGTMKAAKISQIPGLKFDAVLTNDLYVTNTVGQATAGTLYPAGTPLETIIIDMLTAGMSAKDVLRYLATCVFSVTLNGVQITNNQQLDYDEGQSLLLDYGYTYTDGSFGPSNDYSLSVFRTLHNDTANEGHFRADILWADASITSVKIKEGSDVLENITNPNPDGYTEDGHHTYTDDYTFTVQAGLKTYSIVVSYSMMKCHPYKSDGSDSPQSLPAGFFTFTFKINGLSAKDVTPHDASIVRDNGIANPPTEIIIGRTFTTGVDMTVTSQYDIDNNTSTGIWVDDSVNLTANLKRYLIDGYFTPNTGYDLNTFYTYNPDAEDGKLMAGNEVDDASWQIGNGSLSDASYAYDEDSNLFKAEGSIPVSNVTSSTTVKLHLHYAQSTVVPKKSNGVDSAVVVPANTILLTGTFDASTDIDVAPHGAEVSITEVYLYGEPHSYGDTDVSGYITYAIYDGFYTPNNGYSNTKFIANNPTAYQQGGLYKMDASCLPFNSYATVNGVNFTPSTPPTHTGHTYYGCVYFTGLTLQATNTFKITVEYPRSDANVVAHKLSNRPSSKYVTAGTAIDIEYKNYTAPETQYHYVMVTTDSKNVEPTAVNELTNNQAYTVHLNDSTTSSPSGTYTKNFSPAEQVGANRKMFIIAAPVYYSSAKIFVSDNDQQIPFTLVPEAGDNNGILYSSNSTDGIKYRLFKYRETQFTSPYTINKIELYH